MDRIHVLVEGYAKSSVDGNSFLASCSTVLIQNRGQNILIDPGADKQALLSGLERFDLKTTDIDILFLTHWHPDHFLNIQLFPDHDIYDGTTIWKNTGEEIFPNGDSTIDFISNTDIEVLPTPGHREEHVSLIFNDDELGKTCIAQDVFWWEDGQQPAEPTEEQLMAIQDPFLADQKSLKESRRKVLSSGCKWIIPGHGKMFRNPSVVTSVA